MATNAQKDELCDRYLWLLVTIYVVGNKVMLSKQLKELSIAFDRAKDKYEYWMIINELKSHDVIKSESIIINGKATRHQMIILKKYAIRFLEGKESANGVASVPKATTNERIFISIFKTAFVMDKIIPELQKKGVYVSLSYVEEYLEIYCSNLLLNKNKGLCYLEFLREALPVGVIDMYSFNKDTKALKEIEESRIRALIEGSYSRNGKGKGKTKASVVDPLGVVTEKYISTNPRPPGSLFDNPKDRRLFESGFNSLFNAYIYIAKIDFGNDNSCHVDTVQFDLNNNRNLYKIVQNAVVTYNIMKRYLNVEFKFEYTVACIDKDAAKSLEKEANERARDKKGNYKMNTKLQEYFSINKIDNHVTAGINIIFLDYAITDRYLCGIKYINILNSNSRTEKI